MKNLIILVALALAFVLGAFVTDVVAAESLDSTDFTDLAEDILPAEDMPPPPVMLQGSVEVKGSYVLLGDIFANAGDNAEKPIAYAPEPGKQAIFDARWLLKVARNNGLDWQPMSPYDRSIISRASRVVEHDRIIAEVRKALATKNVPADAEIAVRGRSTNYHVAADAPDVVEVRDITYDERTQRFRAVVEIPGSGTGMKQINLSGQIFEVTDIPVLIRDINRDEVISEDDITWQTVHREKLRQDIVTDAGALVGLAAKNRLRAGTGIRGSELQRPMLVKRNALVTIVLSTPYMTLTTQGKALENGSRGDTIRILNVKSKQTVLATVTENNMAVVESTSGALSN